MESKQLKCMVCELEFVAQTWHQGYATVTEHILMFHPGYYEESS